MKAYELATSIEDGPDVDVAELAATLAGQVTVRPAPPVPAPAAGTGELCEVCATWAALGICRTAGCPGAAGNDGVPTAATPRGGPARPGGGGLRHRAGVVTKTWARRRRERAGLARYRWRHGGGCYRARVGWTAAAGAVWTGLFAVVVRGAHAAQGAAAVELLAALMLLLVAGIGVEHWWTVHRPEAVAVRRRRAAGHVVEVLGVVRDGR